MPIERDEVEKRAKEGEVFSRLAAIVDLRFLARYSGEKRGLVPRSVRELGERWGWHRSKVHRLLLALERDGRARHPPRHSRDTWTLTEKGLTTGTRDTIRDKAETHIQEGKKEKKELPSVTPYGGAWNEFLQHRRELRKPLSVRSAEALLRKLSKVEPLVAVAALEESVANGWQGVFPGRAAKSSKASGASEWITE